MAQYCWVCSHDLHQQAIYEVLKVYQQTNIRLLELEAAAIPLGICYMGTNLRPDADVYHLSGSA